MRCKLLIFMGFLACFSASVHASDIVTWVDEQGVRHFGNARLAPQQQGEAVVVQKTNGMDVPDISGVSFDRTRTGGQFIKVERKRFVNLRGFRGHNGRSTRGRGRRVAR